MAIQEGVVGQIADVEWCMSLAQAGRVVTADDELIQCVEFLLSTPLGSVPLRPSFGCAVLELLGRPLPEAQLLAPQLVSEALALWEPRAELVSVRALPAPDEGACGFLVSFRRAGYSVLLNAEVS